MGFGVPIGQKFLSFLFLWPEDATRRSFKIGERVPVFIGNEQLDSPVEGAWVKSLPFCEYQSLQGAKEAGPRKGLLEAQLPVNFGSMQEETAICSMNVTDTVADTLVQQLRRNVDQGTTTVTYYIDDTPVPCGLISDEGEVYTSKLFIMQYDEDLRISFGRCFESAPVKVTAGVPLTFSYKVAWYRRGEANSIFTDEENRMQLLSLLNSSVICLLLCILVACIVMRTVRKDFTRYAAAEVIELESLDRIDDSGWKQIHGDVFRRPGHLLVLSMLTGTGAHYAAASLLHILVSIFFIRWQNKHREYWFLFFSFVWTEVVNGFVGGYTFRLFGGKRWRRAMVAQLCFLPFIAMAGKVHLHAPFYLWEDNSFFQSFQVIAIFLFCCAPMHVIGTKLGRARASRVTFPCRVHQLKRPIPDRSRLFLPGIIVAAGILPFCSAAIELYYAAHYFSQAYGQYRFAAPILAPIALITVTIICCSIAGCYIVLNAEDYRWVWVSFFSGASIALYASAYYVVVLFPKATEASNLLAALDVIGLATGSGTIGFFGTSWFTWMIYRNIKVD